MTVIAAVAAALRRERERAGLSLSELARRAGVAKSTLSQLEAGTGNPGIETLWALGVALGVPFSQLVDPPTPQVRVVRAGEGSAIHAEQAEFRPAPGASQRAPASEERTRGAGKGVSATLLSAGGPQTRRDLYLMAFEPGSVRTADAHNPASIEHVVVAAGLLRTGPADAPIDLAPGDYASFRGDLPHSYEALAPGTWAVLVMEHR